MTRLSGLQTAQTITCHRFAVCLNATLEKKTAASAPPFFDPCRDLDRELFRSDRVLEQLGLERIEPPAGRLA
ncbi:MAG TPA: hypothetical protein VGO08_06675, partial [Burkholderiales bacterium]|nr:hypothetical protein [Burkholderiales bacterium]